MRKTFFSLCKEELRINPNSFVLLGDIGVGGFIDQNNLLIDRVFNMGIAEQSLVSFASGLSLTGGNIIVHTISPFLIERAYEQIKLSCAYNQSKLILISANGPYDYNKLGPTHHCASDVNLISMLPGFNIRLPSSVDDLMVNFSEAMVSKESYYIRMTSRFIENCKSASINNYYYLFKGERDKSYFNELQKKDKAIVCIGESLKYAIEREKYIDHEIFYTNNPLSDLPSEIYSYKSIEIYEPYYLPLVRINPDYSSKIIRKNFKIQFKKEIAENLGWEDFDG
jgi:transketolase C-terminal domain/subunit